MDAITDLHSQEAQVTEEKMVLNYQKITKLWSVARPLPAKYAALEKLYLSHNFLDSLYGMEFFKGLRHLSISHNELLDIEELSHIVCKETLENLSVSHNFLTKHPNYRRIVIRRFPQLQFLDGVPVTPYMRVVVKEGAELELSIMPFVYSLNEEARKLQARITVLQVRFLQFLAVIGVDEVRGRENLPRNLPLSAQAVRGGPGGARSLWNRRKGPERAGHQETV